MPIELAKQQQDEKLCKVGSESSNRRRESILVQLLLRKLEDDLESLASNVLSNSRTEIIVSPGTVIHSSFGADGNCYR